MIWESTNTLPAVSAALAVTFILYLPLRHWDLRISNTRTVPNWQGIVKATLGVLLSAALLYASTKLLTSPTKYDPIFVISLLASLVATLGLSLLLYVEQQRSLKPSNLATLYLVASILCDVVFLTMPSGICNEIEILFPVLARLFIHLTLLIFECHAKRPAYSPLNGRQSPEELNGILSRIFFAWINPILLQGYRNILVSQDLPPLSRDMEPEVTRKAILQAWSQRDKPETKKTLPLALLKCVKQPLLAAIIPRLFLIVFRYSQPILIKKSIRFVTTDTDEAEKNYGYWLVLSATTIYVGLAISTSLFQHRLNRLRLVIRSALVGLIHHKTMTSPSICYDNGESTTLMSSDADSLDGIAEMFHETWAQVVEVVVGVFLLAGEVGWIWPLPLFFIFLCSYMSRFVAKRLQPRQKAWNKATQNRVAAISAMLGSMKIIKMLGFQHLLSHRIQELRKEELVAASKLRWIMVYYNASANALGMFTPAITLAIYAVISAAHGRNLGIETAFTTVAILSMVTHPANMVMTIVPRAIASFAGFDRIQTFLLRPSLVDHRERLRKGTSSSVSWDPASGHILTKPSPTILIQDLTIDEKQSILCGITIEVAAGSLVIISGPVGSGKSTLLRAILGEVTPSHGLIKLSTRRIAYCAQKPWLPSGSIKEVLCGNIDCIDEKWYNKIIDLCCLTDDFKLLPDGDETQIGSRGANLSGGQRQRLALARALYSRSDIVLLDDCFSGLDGETEKHIFDNILGQMGSLRKSESTVLLVSNSTQYFQAADQIFILGDNGIKEQGTWDTIKDKAASITKFNLEPRNKRNNILSANIDNTSAQVLAKDEAEVDLSRQTGDFALYGYYLHFVGWKTFTFLLTCTASCSFFVTIPQYWLRLWTESSNGNSLFFICGFLLLSVMSWVSTNGIVWSSLIRLAPKSGARIHQRLLRIVTSAPLSYFSKTENGSILNRFSQDIQLVDKQLPSALSTIGTQIFKLLVQGALLYFAQHWLALSLPACMLLVYMIQKIYLRTSRQLRFLELEARAAVFSSFLESVEGLETIRAFGCGPEVIEEIIWCLDKSQRPEFILLSLQRWLNIVLDLLAAAIAVSVVAMAVALRGHISGSQVGIALNIMLIANTTLLRLVESWTTLEISLGAVGRLKTLEQQTPPEGKNIENFEPPCDWPSQGHIQIKNINASYHPQSLVLRDISLDIKPGQKIIVCGRTGSGKSTLLLTLLRILELQSGQIVLDGVDISRVRLQLLRERCFITVSQDTLLLSNETLRFNLDPEHSLEADIIVDGLKRTGLWQHFYGNGEDSNRHLMLDSERTIDEGTFDQHPVLDKKVSLFPELSVGQSQLFALCRAIIKVNLLRRAGVKPIVLLDEVTSSLDYATESAIHTIINEEFAEKGHTMIIIAHRLSILAEHIKPGRDVVAVMAEGRLQELITDLSPMSFKTLGESR